MRKLCLVLLLLNLSVAADDVYVIDGDGAIWMKRDQGPWRREQVAPEVKTDPSDRLIRVFGNLSWRGARKQDLIQIMRKSDGGYVGLTLDGAVLGFDFAEGAAAAVDVTLIAPNKSAWKLVASLGGNQVVAEGFTGTGLIKFSPGIKPEPYKLHNNASTIPQGWRMFSVKTPRPVCTPHSRRVMDEMLRARR